MSSFGSPSFDEVMPIISSVFQVKGIQQNLFYAFGFSDTNIVKWTFYTGIILEILVYERQTNNYNDKILVTSS